MKQTTTIALAMLFAGTMSAQEGNTFAGIALGSTKLSRNISASANTTAVNFADESSGGGYFGIIGGYRYFVTPEVAIRGYGEIEIHPVKIEGDDNDESTRYINVIFGADAMYYFKSHDIFDFGAFAGLGLIYTDYGSKILESSASAAGLMFNIGVHADISKEHGFDVGMKFMQNKASKNASLVDGNNRINANIEVKQKPAFFVRYTYQF